LDTQLDALRREDELIQARMARAKVTVQLYMALGGGWSEAQASMPASRGRQNTPIAAFIPQD
jgi:outer membrane protein TolC